MQLIITYLSIAIGLILIVFKTYKKISSQKQSGCNCTDCSLCDLKAEILKKQSAKTL